MIKLETCDKQVFLVEEKIAAMSKTISTLLTFVSDDSPIPLPNVSSSILKLVLEWAQHHKDDPKPPDLKNEFVIDHEEKRDPSFAIPEWDANFLKLNSHALYDLVMAANYLDITALYDVTCHTVAQTLTGRTPEDIRKLFGILNDFTPEEEKVIRSRTEEWLE